MNQREFNRKVDYNTNLFNRQQESNEFTPSLYYLWDKEPKQLSTLQYCGMDHDIYAAAVTGTLAISAKDKHDSILMKRRKIIEVELKTSYLNTKNVWRSAGDKIYIGDRTSIKSQLRATFGGGLPPEDDMLVYLVCCDTTGKWDTEVIGVWQMKGPIAISILAETQNISLKRFMDFGKKKRVSVKTIGWSRYIKTLLKRLPLKKTTNLVA